MDDPDLTKKELEMINALADKANDSGSKTGIRTISYDTNRVEAQTEKRFQVHDNKFRDIEHDIRIFYWLIPFMLAPLFIYGIKKIIDEWHGNKKKPPKRIV